jgi:hypothetical protein
MLLEGEEAKRLRVDIANVEEELSVMRENNRQSLLQV